MPIYNSFIECLALVLLVLDSTQYAEGTMYLSMFGSSSPSTTCSASPSYEYEIQDQFEYTCNPDDGTYALSVSWIHDAALLDNIACPGTPPIPCYQDFAPDIIAATGLFGVSVDFQPCGHPSKGFYTAHYDVHFYRDPVEVREQRICVQPSGAPYCNPIAQTTPAGRAFFNVNYMLGTTEVANMPDNFECGRISGIPGSGVHCEDVSSIPDTPDEWVFPAFVMGSYDGDIAFLEPMASLGFVLGGETYSTELKYNGQTIMNLPTSYTWSNDDTTNRTTILLEGVATDGTCPPTPEIACGEFEVVCDATLEAVGVNCALLSCVDCTPLLVNAGVDCIITPEPTPEIACGEFEVVCDATLEAVGVNCALLSCVDCTPLLVNAGVDCIITPEPTPEIACGEFEVVCDATLEAVGVNCALLSCVDCTPLLVDRGVDCMMTPEPTEPPTSVELSAPAPPAPKPPIKATKKGKTGN